MGGLRRAVMRCTFRFGVSGLRLVGRRLGSEVWGWWVGTRQGRCVLFGVELVGRVSCRQVWQGWVGVGHRRRGRWGW